MAFRFALVTADSEPVDPAVFMCLEPSWSVGDVFTLRAGRSYRILDVQPPTAAAAMEDITAVWTVQKIGGPGLDSCRAVRSAEDGADQAGTQSPRVEGRQPCRVRQSAPGASGRPRPRNGDLRIVRPRHRPHRANRWRACIAATAFPETLDTQERFLSG
jgi:hypothetical protein